MGANLRIGATVDVAEIKSGMNATVDEIRAAAARIPLIFDEAAGRTKKALQGLNEDVKKTAQNITAESFRVAEATKAYNVAVNDLRRATIISRDAKLDDATTSTLLAAAQQKVAAAASEVAIAKKAEADAVAVAASQEEISENFVVAGFQRAEAAISESLAHVRERLVLTGETAHISARDMVAGFSGVGELLGIGLLAGIGGHYLDELAKVNVELDHLHVETGISVSSLAGLQEIVKKMGAEWDPIAMGVVRLNRAMAEAQVGMVEYRRAFEDVGISMEQLKGKTPEERLNIVAEAFAHTDNEARVADAAITLFGRGGLALIPILKEQGAQLEANMRREGELTGITEKSAEAARRWTADTERLSEEFRSVMMPVMEHAEDVVMSIKGVWDAAALSLQVLFEGAATVIVSLSGVAARGAQAMFHALSGNWRAVEDDINSASRGFGETWKAEISQIDSAWQKTLSDFRAAPPAPELPRGVDPGDLHPETRGRGASRGSEVLKADEEQLNELKVNHQVTLEEEISFWQARLAEVKKGSEEYRAILAKLAPLMQREGKMPTVLGPEVIQPDLGDVVTSFQQDLQEIARSNAEVAKQYTEAWLEARDEQIRLAQEHYRDVEEDSAFEVRMGRMTAEQRIALLRKAAEEENRIEVAVIRAREIAEMGNLQSYQRDVNREIEITREYARQVVLLNQQAALQTNKQWSLTYQKLTAEINDNVARWIVTQQGFARSMAQMMASISENFVRNVMKMTEQFLVGILLQKAGQKSQILGDAKTAAANTYAAVSAIPIVGPFLAPPAAAAAFAGVMAFDSFNEGGVVRYGNGAHVPILAKQGERVLTPSQNTNFERMVNQNTATQSSLVQHLHYEPKVSAYDRSGMRATLKTHADDILDIVRDGYSRGALAI